MRSQVQHPDLTLTITSGVGTFRRTATFHDGAWKGHDLTHPFDDHRSHITYGEPGRAPMTQEVSVLMTQQPAQPSPLPPPSTSSHGLLPTPPQPPLTLQQVTCMLPVKPPEIPTPPLPQSSTVVRHLTRPSPTLMLPSSFQGEVISGETDSPQTTEPKGEVSTQRIVVFKDCYERLALPVEIHQRDDSTQPLIGHQGNPKLKERQKQQQRAEDQAARAPVDLRNEIEQLAQKKRAREQANRSANPSPAQQPVARKMKLTTELISRAETYQLDLTAKDAVRLQREVLPGTDAPQQQLQKFERTHSKGDPEAVKSLEKAFIGMHYIRPVKKPVLLTDRTPLGSANSSRNYEGTTRPTSVPYQRISN